MTGFRRVVKKDQGAMKLLTYASEKVNGAISLMSAPAVQEVSAHMLLLMALLLPAKALSFPVRTMAPISLSSSYFFKASLSSTNKALERALRALGRFRVTVPVSSETAITHLKLTILKPTPGLGDETMMFS
jgi:hypothetical protein